MPIFQKSVLKKHLNDLDDTLVEKAYQTFLANYTPSKIEEIKTLKEEEYQDGFLRDLFVDALGYTLRPEEKYNLQREFKNQTDGKKADGAILKDEKAIAVIELKSTKTKDLTKVTQQAFNYKNNQPECKYVITSNFHKLRFYIDYANEYEEFDLFQLSKEDFKLLYLLLNKEHIFSNLPLQLKEETKFHEQKISDKLYKDYSKFKRKLYDNLTKNHPNSDKLTLFKKSQKLLDRFLFILFAEDSGLLPPNSISEVIKRFEVLKENDAYKPLYEIFKQYFGYMNIGRPGKTAAGDIPAYNGGLFYEDKDLNAFKIDDEILIDDLLNLSEYDFSTEVDVNILGHIFEHSLNEIEEITAEIEGTITDKTKSKRKKDGVFYTPKYITQYIVENTVGTLCNEKRQELNLEEIEFDGTYRTKSGKLSEKGKKLYTQLTDYKDWLITLKIIDPACGSGAFLNQALNFLIEEHTTIDDIIAELTNSPLRLFDVDKTILENNLFGVDINEESVEIARLSLWLRTAQKGRKLSSLNQNIKCGNSLIDDPEIAGDKAFDWNKEFKAIMDNGGFDCVIGNPPYVQVSKNKEYYDKEYKTSKCGDLYALFYEKGIELLKENGLFSYITPSLFIKGIRYETLRLFLLNNTTIITIDDKGDGVFQDVQMPTAIVVAYKKKNNKQDWNNYIPGGNLINKIEKNSTLLSSVSKIKRGLEIGKDKVFNFDSNKVRILTGEDVSRYQIKQYQSISFETYNDFKKDESYFNGERIIIRETGNRITSLYLDENVQQNRSLYSILLKNKNYKFILSLINSSLMQFYYKSKFGANTDIFPKIRIAQVKDLPIKEISQEAQQSFIEKADKMLALNKELQEKSTRFINRLSDNFELATVSKKVATFYEYDFKNLVAELKKQKVNLSLVQQDEWEEYFTAYQTEINEIQNQITTTDNEIDQMVYELYELTDSEIAIVEN